MPVVVIDPAIDHVEGADVTAALQAVFDANAGLAGTPLAPIEFIFPDHARYRLDGTLNIIPQNWFLRGVDVRFKAFTVGLTNRHGINLVGGYGYHAKGLSYVGGNLNGGVSDAAYPGALLEHQHGYNVQGTQGVELEDWNCSDVNGDFIYMTNAPGDTTIPTRNVWIHGTGVWTRNGRQAVSLISVEHLLLEGFNMSEIRMSPFDYEPTSINHRLLDIVIRNGIVGQHRLTFCSALGGINDTRADHVTFQNVVCVATTGTNDSGAFYGSKLGFSVTGFPTVHRTFWTVRGCVSATLASSGSGFAENFTYVDDLVWVNNYVPCVTPHTPPMNLLLATNCLRVRVRGNDFPGGVEEVVLAGVSSFALDPTPTLAALRLSVRDRVHLSRNDPAFDDQAVNRTINMASSGLAGAQPAGWWFHTYEYDRHNTGGDIAEFPITLTDVSRNVEKIGYVFVSLDGNAWTPVDPRTREDAVRVGGGTFAANGIPRSWSVVRLPSTGGNRNQLALAFEPPLPADAWVRYGATVTPPEFTADSDVMWWYPSSATGAIVEQAAASLARTKRQVGNLTGTRRYSTVSTMATRAAAELEKALRLWYDKPHAGPGYALNERALNERRIP